LIPHRMVARALDRRTTAPEPEALPLSNRARGERED
jgi:hypothetical protein